MKTLRELEAAATPGPWYAALDERSTDGLYVVGAGLDDMPPALYVTEADAALIAAARNALPYLLDVVGAARIVAVNGDYFYDDSLERVFDLKGDLIKALAALDEATK